jgi:hypothetical protein
LTRTWPAQRVEKVSAGQAAAPVDRGDAAALERRGAVADEMRVVEAVEREAGLVVGAEAQAIAGNHRRAGEARAAGAHAQQRVAALLGDGDADGMPAGGRGREAARGLDVPVGRDRAREGGRGGWREVDEGVVVGEQQERPGAGIEEDLALEEDGEVVGRGEREAGRRARAPGEVERPGGPAERRAP